MIVVEDSKLFEETSPTGKEDELMAFEQLDEIIETAESSLKSNDYTHGKTRVQKFSIVSDSSCPDPSLGL